MPVTHRRAIRTTNLFERLVVEERRHLKIVPNAWGERRVLKLVFGAMTRAAERWRSIRFAGFERRRIAEVGKAPDAEFEASDTTSPASRQAPALDRISSTSRT